MKGKVWAAVWGLMCLSWLYDFVMVLRGVEVDTFIQGCAFLMSVLYCANCVVEALAEGDEKNDHP